MFSTRALLKAVTGGLQGQQDLQDRRAEEAEREAAQRFREAQMAGMANADLFRAAGLAESGYTIEPEGGDPTSTPAGSPAEPAGSFSGMLSRVQAQPASPAANPRVTEDDEAPPGSARRMLGEINVGGRSLSIGLPEETTYERQRREESTKRDSNRQAFEQLLTTAPDTMKPYLQSYNPSADYLSVLNDMQSGEAGDVFEARQDQRGFNNSTRLDDHQTRNRMRVQNDAQEHDLETSSGSGGVPMAAAEARTRILMGLPRAEQAFTEIEQFIGQNGGAPMTSWLDKATPGRFFQPDDVQAFRAAGDRLASAILRVESGAAITEDEARRYAQQFIPQPTDKPETARQKMEALRSTLQRMRALGGQPETATSAPRRGIPASGPAPSEMPRDATRGRPAAADRARELMQQGHSRADAREIMRQEGY